MLSVHAIKKILLINPPIEDFYQTEIRQQPLGLKYIQAVLNQQGYEVDLLDALAVNQKQTIPLPAQLGYLREFYPLNDLSPFKLFNHYRHYGLSFEEMAVQIKNYRPDLIGISVNFTPYSDMAINTAKVCKSVLPEVPVIAGGHHASAVPEALLQSGFFDVVILGEGEYRLLKLVQALTNPELGLLNHIDGLAYKNELHIMVNPCQTMIQNLDHLPLLEHQGDLAMIITSRGCPLNCNFCSINQVMGNKLRLRSIDAVLKELDRAINRGVHRFDFEDDNLTWDRNRAKNLFKKIIERFADHGLILSAMNGILADSLDEELIRLMKLAGFEWLNIPLVTGAMEIQKKINRHQSRTHFEKVVAWAQQYGLKIVAYLIIGLPEDDLDQMVDDIVFLAGLPVLIGPSIFYPPPGSVTFNNCIQKNYITGHDHLLYRSSAVPVVTEKFSRQDLITLFRLVRAVNYMKHLIDNSFNRDYQLMEYLSQNKIIGNGMWFDRKLTAHEIGILLIQELFQNKKLRGLTLKSRNDKAVHYKWLDYKISTGLVQKFLSQLSGKNITGILRPWKMSFR